MITAFGILNDLTRCIGCGACVQACRESNELPADGEEGLRATSWSTVETRAGVHVRRQCMHCITPTCVSVCPVGALEKTAEGPVIYDEDRCMGCRYCMVACPFDVPCYEWTSRAPRVRKCQMCFATRIAAGQEPACTSVCPTEAAIFGEREALIAEAHARLRAHPQRYVDHIYGVEEAGGTSVLYLSPVPFAELGFPTAHKGDSYPRLTWEVLSRIPNIVSTGGVAMLGLWWIINRREKLRRSPEHLGGERGHETDIG